MSPARILVHQELILDNGKFKAHIKVFEVPKSAKFPDGYKVSCSLVDCETGVLRVLLDNHQPYGYHLHTKLPENKNFRVSVNVVNHPEAIKLFLTEVKRVLNEK